jgi:hypothetical protein
MDAHTYERLEEAVGVALVLVLCVPLLLCLGGVLGVYCSWLNSFDVDVFRYGVRTVTVQCAAAAMCYAMPVC